MAISHEVTSPIQEPSVCVVYGEFHGQVNRVSKVHFDRVSLPGGVHPLEHHVVAEALAGRYVGWPSVATTPGDIVHIVWEDMDLNQDVPDIFYTQRSHGAWPPPPTPPELVLCLATRISTRASRPLGTALTLCGLAACCTHSTLKS